MVSLLLFAIESVADKVPLVDSTWDVVQTVARPLVGGTIGALVAGEDGATALVQKRRRRRVGRPGPGQPLGQGPASGWR